MKQLSIPGRSRVVVPPKPTTSQIKKRLKPIFIDDRSNRRKGKKVRFIGWNKERGVLVKKRAKCLQHIAILSVLLVLVSVTVFRANVSYETLAGSVGTEETDIAQETNLLNIDEYLTHIPRMMRGEFETLMFREGMENGIVETIPFYVPDMYEYPEEMLVYESLEDIIEEPYLDIEFFEEFIYEPVPPVVEAPIVEVGPYNIYVVWNFFAARGFSPQAIAGIIGNLQQEAGVGINPNTEGDVHLATSSRGIAQWRECRLTNLQAFANQRGVPWNTLYVQLEFMYHEMNSEPMQRRFRGETTSWGSYMPSLTRKGATPVDGIDGLKQETCVENAVRVMDAAFHRSGTPNMPRRIQFAHDAFERFYGI